MIAEITPQQFDIQVQTQQTEELWQHKEGNYAPVTVEGILDPTSQANQDLLMDFYGPRGMWLYNRSLYDNKFNRYKVEQRVNQDFLGRLAERYQLSSPEHAFDFYFNQLRTANETVSYVLDKALPNDYKDTFGFRNEVDLYNGPADRLQRISYNHQDEVEQFEHGRQMVLAAVAAEVEYKSRLSRPREHLSQIQDILNKDVYSLTPEGTITSPRIVHAVHDNETNEYIDEVQYDIYNLQGLNVCEDCHIKEHKFKARYVEGIGYVLTNPRKKRDKVAVIKAIDKARENDGIINLQRDATDPIGIMFASLGDDSFSVDSKDLLAEKVFQALRREHPDLDVKEKKKTNEKRSISEQLPWSRYMVSYGGLLDPVEMIFYNGPDYVNYHYRVGDIRNMKEGVKAHSLYEVARSQSIFRAFYPERLYNGVEGSPYHVEQSMTNHLNKAAKDLKDIRKSPLNGIFED